MKASTPWCYLFLLFSAAEKRAPPFVRYYSIFASCYPLLATHHSLGDLVATILASNAGSASPAVVLFVRLTSSFCTSSLHQARESYVTNCPVVQLFFSIICEMPFAQLPHSNNLPFSRGCVVPSLLGTFPCSKVQSFQPFLELSPFFSNSCPYLYHAVHRLINHFESLAGRPRSRKGESLEFAARGGLLEADVAGGDVGLEVVFALDGGASEAAEHGDLADVIEGVSNRSLKEAFRRSVKRFV